MVGSGCGKASALLNLINNQPDIDKIYLYAKDPYKAKYQYLIFKRDCTGLQHVNHPKALIEYSSDMEDVYKNIEEYNIRILYIPIGIYNTIYWYRYIYNATY